MRLNLLLVAAVMMSGCAAWSPATPAPAGPFQFSGTIYGVQGTNLRSQPIAAATLTIVNGIHSNMAVTTDAEGHFAFPRMESGRFSLTVSAAGYVTTTPEVALSRD